MNITKLLKIGLKLTNILSFFAWSVASAVPQDGTVVAGSANISQQNSQTVINQQSQNTVINWSSFNTSSSESVLFHQPNSSSIALNKITNGLPTNFSGSLSANGQVWVINPAGVLFGNSANINVAGLLATTNMISNNNFMSGNYIFDAPTNLSASIINNGNINIANSGIAVLVGPNVINNGVITANLGTVQLSTGGAFVLDLYGDNLINFGSNSPIQNGSVANNNLISASGGKVYMTANAAAGILDNVISMSGVIQATTVSTGQQGEIILNGGNSGVTKVSGKLIAPQGHIETSGHVLILDPDVVIDASHGGSWLVDPWNITVVSAAGTCTNIGCTSPFTPTGTNSQIGSDLIMNQLNLGTNVTLNTASAGADAGNITISSAITWATAAALALTANNNIIINAAITGVSGSLNLSAINAANSITTNSSGTINVANFNLIQGRWNQVTASLPAFTVSNNFQLNSGNGVNAAVQFIRATSGTGAVGTPYILTDIYGVQGIGSNNTTLGQSFTLANNIDATTTSTWNSGLGFVPISLNGVNYSGTFNGANFTISNLFINRPALSGVGLFDTATTTAHINNLILTGVNITGLDDVGGIAGSSNGTLNNVSTSGSVTGLVNVGGVAGFNNTAGIITNSSSSASITGLTTGTPSSGAEAGGLVGENFGHISGSFATGNVLGDAATYYNAGGLVGQNWTTGVITTSYATGNVRAVHYSGGITGWNYGSIDNSHYAGCLGCTVTITAGGIAAGGIAGFNFGTIQATSPNGTYATGTINGSAYVGGIVGWNDGNVGTALGNTIYSNANITGLSYVGGVVGGNFGLDTNHAFVTNTYATGTVSGTTYVGGVIGTNGFPNHVYPSTPTISVTNSYYTNTTTPITGVNYVGGIIGFNDQTATLDSASYVDAKVTGSGSYIGGVIGYNNHSIPSATYITSNVTVTGTGAIGQQFIGGYIGKNDVNGGSLSNFSNPFTNTVTAPNYDFVGGIVGANYSAATMTTVSNAATITGLMHVGGIAGEMVSASSLLTNAHNTGTIIGSSVSNYTGGLTGANFGAISNSNNIATVTGGFSVGGISGYVEATGALTDVYSIGNISGNLDRVGGITGTLHGTLTATVFGNTYATGTITGTNVVSGNYLGGLVGISDGVMSNVYNNATVIGNNYTYVGGIVGYNNTASPLSAVINNASVTGLSEVGGLVGRLASGTLNGNSSNSGAVSGAGIDIGGIVGNNFGTISGTALVPITASGTVKGTGATGNSLGGIVGNNSAGSGVISFVSSLSSNTVFESLGSVYSSVGGVVGYNLSSAAISNVTNAASVTGANQVGGIIGQMLTGGMLNGNSSNSGAVTGTGSDIGGIVGFNYGTILSPVTATGTVTGTGGGQAVGGLVGYNLPSGVISGLTNPSSNTVNAPTDSYVGGIVGLNYGTTAISDVTNAASVMGLSFVGGIVGSMAVGTTLNGNSSNSGLVSGAGGEIGGMVGDNSGTITSTALLPASGTVIGTGASGNNVGGLVGLDDSTGVISGLTNPSANTVTALNYTSVGGVIGFVASGASIININNSAQVTGKNNVGGLIGSNSANLSNSNSFSTGNVIGSGTNLGALIGYNNGIISPASQGLVYATGTVTGNGTSSGLGGLIGKNDINGVINNLNYTGIITALNYSELGGLVGINAGSITNSYTTSDITSSGNELGALVGHNSGSINFGGILGEVTATGIITATGSGNSIGGIVGNNAAGGAIYSMTYNNSVSAINYIDVGGIAGSNAGLITTSYNGVNITGKTNVGGIVGNNTGGSVTDDYNSGLITAVTGSAGGIAGNMTGGTLNIVYNTGKIFNDGSQSAPTGFGGVVGTLSGNSVITNAYNYGFINGNFNGQSGTGVGGIIGTATFGGSASIGFLYNIGFVSGSSNTGGLIGKVISGTPIFAGTSYWNTDTSGQASGVSNFSNANIIGLNTNAMIMQSSYSGWNFSTPIWDIVEGVSYPYLNIFYSPGIPRFITSTSNSAPGGTDTNLYINGSATPLDVFSTGANGAGYFLEGFNNISDIDHTVFDNDLLFMNFSNSPIVSNAIAIMPNSGGQAGIHNGLFLDNNTVTVGLASAANSLVINNSLVNMAKGSLTGSNILYALSGSNLIINSGKNFTTTAPTTYTSIGNIDTTSGNITFNGPVLLAANSVFTANTSGNITFESTIDDGFDLIANAAFGTVTFNGIVGTTPLNSLTANANLINMNAGVINTVNDQDYNGPVMLLSDVIMTATALTSNIMFDNTVNGLFNLDTSTPDATLFSNNVNTASITVSGDTVFNKLSDQTAMTTGSQTYGGLVTLDNNVAMTAGSIGSPCLLAGECEVSFTLGTIGVDGVYGPNYNLSVFTYDSANGPTGAGISGTVYVSGFTMGGTGGGIISPLVPDFSTVGGATAVGAWDNTVIAAGATGLYCVNNSCNTNALIITATDDSKTYGQNFTPSLYTVSGLSGGDNISSVSFNSPGDIPTASVLGGPYVITPSNAMSLGITNNHYASITYINGLLTVNPAPLILTPISQTKNEGEQLPSVTTSFAAIGLQNGQTVGNDNVTISSTGLSAAANTGTFPITAISNLTGGAFDPSNYAINYVPGGNIFVIGTVDLVNKVPAVETVRAPEKINNCGPSGCDNIVIDSFHPPVTTEYLNNINYCDSTGCNTPAVFNQTTTGVIACFENYKEILDSKFYRVHVTRDPSSKEPCWICNQSPKNTKIADNIKIVNRGGVDSARTSE